MVEIFPRETAGCSRRRGSWYARYSTRAHRPGLGGPSLPHITTSFDVITHITDPLIIPVVHINLENADSQVVAILISVVIIPEIGGEQFVKGISLNHLLRLRDSRGCSSPVSVFLHDG